MMQAVLENQALAHTRDELDTTAACENVTCAWLPDGSVLRNANTLSVSCLTLNCGVLGHLPRFTSLHHA